jgi:hypothetical protein
MPNDEMKKEIALILRTSKKGMTWEELLNDLRKTHKTLERFELEELLIAMKPAITKVLKKDERSVFREYWVVK